VVIWGSDGDHGGAAHYRWFSVVYEADHHIFGVFLWGGKTCCALIATPNVDNANRRQKKGKS
jgi:hypothetical protein